ncbi:tRNA lysidine(34) synthetase TilS [Alteromonas sp. ASW11-130]|uniref:tRNA lysidine(34) synthetase TilS n=1 Tax=Alteromonas sp. ASW11-130 TaxID=3015775 RepID=UPI002242167B|nr:tRNA lysidine(34) synthetase TilS [Alteromonas sp. ASW11-130]MCW8091654.1 tRNA lysidine(34) synthetase TilS [Alteromonas sp. ASW11-130]
MDNIRATVLAELQHALSTLQSQPVPAQTLVVALSGGKDSVVLLDILYRIAGSEEDNPYKLPSLYAFHVNHGLSSEADDWMHHCSILCAHRNIPFESATVTLQSKPRISLEAQARELRYTRLLEFTKRKNGVLVTAHHLHDQVETMLLQLKRGAGPKGLGSMQAVSFRNEVPIIRPMLDVSQEAINQYAITSKLSWVEDESNIDERFDRNFLRRQIIPLMEARWPAVSRAISRSAQFCNEQAQLLEQVSKEKLLSLQDAENKLDVALLLDHSELWQKQILREWLRQFFPLSPSSSVLLQIQKMLIAKEGSQPLVGIGEYSVRRFKGKLWCINRFEHLPEHLPIPDTGVTLPVWGKRLNVDVAKDAQWDRGSLSLVTGLPSIKLRPVGKLHSKLFKEWLKEWEVPPWERIQVPLVFYNDSPVAVCLHNQIVALQTPPTVPLLEFSYN